jgi:electron transfer flavoprotein beta subunit|tara:strand:+ start:451 stop:1284 length:834 start_codon:yes stop_codon:yes gene_type:complete
MISLPLFLVVKKHYNHIANQPIERVSYMKIIVPIKRVVDYNVKVRPLSDQSDVDLNNVKMSMNPFCEIAIEEAVRLKEAGTATEVIAVTVGTSASQEQLRTALALGADRAILIETDVLLEPLAIAKALAKVIEKEAPQLVILGKQAIDGDNNQTGQMLAALLGYAQATFASELSIEGDFASVTREIDGGLQTIKVSLPAIVTTDLRLNEPRYASLPNIMKAKKKEMDIHPVDSLGIDVSPRLELISVEPPATRQAGIIVESVEELVSKLKNEAKVIS